VCGFSLQPTGRTSAPSVTYSAAAAPIVACGAISVLCLYLCLFLLSFWTAADLNASHSVSMLETIRTACLCLKLSAAAKQQNGSTAGSNHDARKNRTSSRQRQETSGDCRHRIELTDCNEKKETLNEDNDDDDEDVDFDDAGGVATTLSYKDLFRMATLGGATGNCQCDIYNLRSYRRCNQWRKSDGKFGETTTLFVVQNLKV